MKVRNEEGHDCEQAVPRVKIFVELKMFECLRVDGRIYVSLLVDTWWKIILIHYFMKVHIVIELFKHNPNRNRYTDNFEQADVEIILCLVLFAPVSSLVKVFECFTMQL